MDTLIPQDFGCFTILATSVNLTLGTLAPYASSRPDLKPLIDGLLKNMFRGLQEKYKSEIEIVRKAFPADEFRWRDGPEGTVKLTFGEAVDLLVANGVSRTELDYIE